MSTTEPIAAGYNALAPEVREQWAVEQIQTIRNTVAKDLTLPEFQMGMALAGKHKLNPLAHEIWFAKSQGRVMIMTGRDGYLAIARRQSGYKGMDCDVLRANDEFRVERKPDGERLVHHSYEGSDVDRGEVRGAWAIVYFEGKVPFYFYAAMSEYKPRSEAALKYSPWGTRESVMILKCAQSYALRIASGTTGLVGEEESARALERPDLTAGDGDGSAPGIELPATVEAVIRRATELGHVGYSDRPTIEVALGGRNDDAVMEWTARAMGELETLAVRKAQEPADADVVTDPEPAAPQEGAQDASDTLSGGVALPAEIPNSVGSSAAPDSRPAAQEPSDDQDVPIDLEGLPDPPEGEVATDPEVLRRRLADLEAQDTSALDDAHTQLVLDEIEWISSQLAAQDVPPGQESLLS